MTDLFLRIARRIYRTPEETAALGGPASSRAKVLLFGTANLFLLGSLAWALVLSVTHWATNEPRVRIEKSAWHVLYQESAVPCPESAGESGGCLADPANPALWSSPANRADEARHIRTVEARPEKEYWLGARVSAPELKAALDAQANFFVAGLLRGDYSLWVDGEFLLKGRWTDYEPLLFPVPMNRLRSHTPLSIAIRLIPNAKVQPPPDMLNVFGGASGFGTKADATGVRRYLVFWSMARPLALIAANALLALIFFNFWSAARDKPEYFYMALFALVHALIHLRGADIFYMVASRRFACTLEVFNGIWFGPLGMFTGLAFARVRSSWFKYAVPAALLIPVPVVLAVHDLIRLQRIATWSMGYPAGLVIFAGALACAFESFYLKIQGKGGKVLRTRARRLALFSLGLVGIGIGAVLNERGATPTVLNVLIAKKGPLYLLVFLGAVALAEYREERLIIQKTPVSKYHRRAVLPESLAGTVLVLDLKNSEWLFRVGARYNRAGEFVSNCMSHIWAAILDGGGLVIQTEGDAILAFFEDESIGEPGASVTAALAAIDAVARNLGKMERQLREQGLLTLESQRLCFRAGVVTGAIRPVWQEMGSARYASWVEAGGTNAFVESARLMEIERQIPVEGGAVSVAVLPAELGERARGLPSRTEESWLFMAREFTGKHGRIYRVCAYVPGSAREGLRRAG